jgi:hypothetical protein
VVTRKLGLNVVWPKYLFFNSKHLKNHDKPIYGLKNKKLSQNQSEIKNQPELRYVFSWIL